MKVAGLRFRPPGVAATPGPAWTPPPPLGPDGGPVRRFGPPGVAAPPELRWTLLRASGPEGGRLEGAFDAGGALALARLLSLAPRIGTRVPAARLRLEAGPEIARGFIVSHLHAL